MLYSSNDYGANWQPVDVAPDLAGIRDIVFHPDTPGLVYLSTGGTGFYRSTDGGSTWDRIDDLQKPDMLKASHLTIATHPRHILFVGGNNAYRSLDGGETWGLAHCPPTGGVFDYMFLDGDSTRLYAATWFGLFYSSNAGTSWQRAAGVLGRVHVTALDYAVGNNFTILYAATSGGDTVVTNGMAADTPRESTGTDGSLVEAGIYRYVQHQNIPGLPGVPVLVTPANNALTTDYTPRLDWNVAAFADHYQLQVATSNTFATTVIAKPNIIPSDFTPTSDLLPNSRYYWRVRTYNPLGKVSSWSAVHTFRTALLTPTLQAPADGFNLLNNRPAFDWDDVPGATGYTIKISRNSGFTSLVGTYLVSPSTYTLTADLPVNMTLYWRVQSRGANGPSAWSAVRTVNTANPPGVPALLLPASNALTTDYTPRLNWGLVTLPAATTFGYYQIQVADNAAFTLPVIDVGAGVLTDRLVHETTPGTNLNPNTKYYWRVRSYNTDGEYSAWSLVRTFRTALLSPTLQAPADTITVPTVRSTFDWDNVSGANGYSLQISKNNTFTPLVLTATITGGTNSQYTPLVSLPVSTTLYWRVKANGLNGPSLWSSPVWSFTTPNPPGVPLLTAPALNSLVTDYTPTLKWSRPIIPIGTFFEHYQVQIATDLAFTAIIQDVDATDYNTPEYTASPDLNPNTKYYWRSRTWNTLNHYSIWSAVRYFRTALSAPVLSTPTDGGTTTLLRPPFNWADVPGAASYTIQVSRNSTFTSLVVTKTVVPSTYTATINLPANIPLYWRVKANGVNGPSLWSASWSFNITP
jgi:hypothetical protein